MKNYLLLLILLSLLSCNNKVEQRLLKNGFANEVGKYKIGENNFQIFRYKDGTLTFAMQDGEGNILIDGHNIAPFSLYQKWSIYFDNNQNIWFYNSDFQTTSVWLYSVDGTYVRHDYCEESIPLPEAFINNLGLSKDRICYNVDTQ